MLPQKFKLHELPLATAWVRTLHLLADWTRSRCRNGHLSVHAAGIGSHWIRHCCDGLLAFRSRSRIQQHSSREFVSGTLLASVVLVPGLPRTVSSMLLGTFKVHLVCNVHLHMDRLQRNPRCCCFHRRLAFVPLSAAASCLPCCCKTQYKLLLDSLAATTWALSGLSAGG